jgi:hypothetical protein
MKIHEYYRDLAGVNLNGSIAALVPSIIIVGINLIYIQQKPMMVLTIPFLLYSLISFQVYLFRKKQSMAIEKNTPSIQNHYHSLFEAKHLLIVFMNTQSAKLFLYFPNGHLAGTIKKHKGNFFSRSTFHVLYHYTGQVMGIYQIKKNKIIVYDHNRNCLGCLEKERRTWLKGKKELLDAEGKLVGEIEGSRYFMDEKVLNSNNKQEARLRRGWMPFKWNNLFPEPNTPVLSLSEHLTEKDKLLRISFLINEYFIRR